MSPSKHLTGPSPEISDTDALAQWTLFLNDYSRGRERPPPPPLRKSSHNAKSLPSFEVPLYPHGEISPEVARTIAEFYGQHGFLPPPRAEEESVRLHTIQEYNLFRSDQTENFHRCSSLVSAYFHIAPVCTISLFHNDVQVVVSKAGDFPVKLVCIPVGRTISYHSLSVVVGEGLVTETSLCGHVVLKKNGEITELTRQSTTGASPGNPWCATGLRERIRWRPDKARGRSVQSAGLGSGHRRRHRAHVETCRSKINGQPTQGAGRPLWDAFRYSCALHGRAGGAARRHGCGTASACSWRRLW
ncbi:hypothetical protein B0H10DRAFT_1355760 [Mycena sp. CBHHK59/15]|nr:hypothetical protein B0H10DRAFT_1355760 [Mycena sp. CBHHK59/15]